jgi:hypothetical protein
VAATRNPALDAASRRLVDAHARMIERERLDARIRAALAALHEHVREATALRGRIRSDEADADSLERVTVKALVHAMAGDRRRRAAADRRDLAACQSELVATKARVAAVQREIRTLRARADAMGDVVAEYEAALAAKEELLADLDARVAAALRRAAASGARRRDHLQRCSAAIDTGLGVRRAARTVEELVEQARGSRYGDSYLATARAEARRVNIRLARFARDLEQLPDADGLLRPFLRRGRRADGGPRLPAYAVSVAGWPPGALAARRTILAALEAALGGLSARRRRLKAEIVRLESRRLSWIEKA